MKTLEKAFRVLEYLMEKGGAGVTEISQALNLSKNNVFRALATFEEHGLVEKDEETDKYKLAVNAAKLGYGFMRHSRLIRLALPELKSLRFAVKETVNLALLDERRRSVVYVAHEESVRPVKVEPRAGKRFALEAETASARALKKALVEGGPAVEYELSADGELSGVACAVVSGSGRPEGALEVLAPSYRLPPDKIKKEVEPLLRRVALTLSKELGYDV
ncbi:MAG: IclR family transcriptional regulator [Aquificae bacterium]|nr:IclR family transcriptional regulator [Aquificota bacterium]